MRPAFYTIVSLAKALVSPISTKSPAYLLILHKSNEGLILSRFLYKIIDSDFTEMLENRFSITETIDPANPPSECSGTDLQTNSPVLILIHNLQAGDVSAQRVRDDSTFQHPSVCKLLSIIEKEDQVFVVTDRPLSSLHGLTVKRQKKPWDEDKIIHILANVTSALKYAQERGLHHGKIRTTSIYLNEETAIAKLAGFTSSTSTPPVRSIEYPGRVSRYLAPELRKNPADWNPYKFDVFSLGLVLLILADPKKSFDTTKENTIIDFLKKLEFSSDFVSILSKMLKFDVNERPDAKELAELIVSKWPKYVSLFSVPKLCSQCGGFSPVYSCLCSFPLPLVCESCWNGHCEDGNWHATVTAEMREQVRSIEELSRIKHNFIFLFEFTEALAAALKDIDEYTKECRRLLNLYIENINCEFEQKMEELQRVKERAQQMKSDIDSNFLQKLVELSAHQEQIMKSIEKPYFFPTPLESCNAPPRVEYSEQISALEAASIRLSFPRFYGTQLHLYDAETAELQSVSDLPEAMDATASLLFLNRREVFVCGGRSKPTCCFRMRLDTLEWKELENSISPRASAGLALLSNRVYIFGGSFAEKSAEARILLPKDTPASLKSMQYPRSRFNPCVCNELIYLPGQSIESYCPKTDTYTSIMSICWPFDIVTVAVLDGRIYIFTNTSAGIGSVECRRILSRSDQNAVNFVSNPAPLLLGNSLYLFNPEAASVLRMQIGRLVIKSEVGKSK